MVLEQSRSANILLHIGYHKTGSTFLQRKLFDSGEKRASTNVILAIGPRAVDQRDLDKDERVG